MGRVPAPSGRGTIPRFASDQAALEITGKSASFLILAKARIEVK